MKFEVFHRGLLGRPDVIAVDMIHMPGLWGLCFSHHMPHNNHPRYSADTTTEGVLRFIEDARHGRDCPALETLTGCTITTHHMDADALLPVWVLLHPDAALGRREQLERIARSGDFFIYLDEADAKVNFVVEELHQRLRGSGLRGDRVVDDNLTRNCFAQLLPELESLLDDPAPYAELWETPLRTMHSDLDYLAKPGRIAECWAQHTSLVTADHALDAHALNTVCRSDLLLVWRTDVPERRIEVRPAIAWYDLTSIPHRPRYGLAALAARLNAAEAGQSPDVWEYRPGPVTLAAAASRLSQERVLEVIAEWLVVEPAENVSEVYRADVHNLFRHQSRHTVFTSHERFARANSVSFVAGEGYGGLHYRGTALVRRLMEPTPVLLLEGKMPAPFAVSDDFYWNRAKPEALRLQITYEDHAPGSFRIEYDAWGDPFRPTESVTLTGDGRAKCVTLSLDNARLGNSQDEGADLRLMRTPGTTLAVRELELCKTS